MGRDLIRLSFAILFVCFVFAIVQPGCGGGSSNGSQGSTSNNPPAPQNAVDAIANGASYPNSSITTQWVSSACLGETHLVITTDGEISALWNIPPGPTVGIGLLTSGVGILGTWMPTQGGSGLFIGWGGQCFQEQSFYPYPVSMLNIQGSLASDAFTCLLVDSGGNSTACSFVLAPLPNSQFIHQPTGCSD